MIDRKAGDMPYGVGVLVAKDGGFLCGARGDTGEISGAGGYMKEGETPEMAAIRETQEEFGITPKSMTKIGALKNNKGLYQPCVVFLCTEYEGEPKCETEEMCAPCFINPNELKEAQIKMYPAFEDSIELLNGMMPRSE